MRSSLHPRMPEWTPDQIANRWDTDAAQVRIRDTDGEEILTETIERTPDQTPAEFRRACARRGLQLVAAGAGSK